MKEKFANHYNRMPHLFSELMASPAYPMEARAGWQGLSAIYVFLEGDKPRHVGRTRNLRQRIRGHAANSHYSASFAFAEARRALGILVTYKKGDGRAALMEREDFRAEFDRQRRSLASMTVKFLQVDDPIDQYLLELYAALQLGTSLAEFGTS